MTLVKKKEADSELDDPVLVFFTPVLWLVISTAMLYFGSFWYWLLGITLAELLFIFISNDSKKHLPLHETIVMKSGIGLLMFLVLSPLAIVKNYHQQILQFFVSLWKGLVNTSSGLTSFLSIHSEITTTVFLLIVFGTLMTLANYNMQQYRVKK